MDNHLAEYAPLVRAMARRYQGPGLEREDLEQEAWLALLEAKASYRPERNVPRPAYYRSRVRTALANVLRRYRRDGLFWRRDSDTVAVWQDRKGEMLELVSHLPARQAQVLKLYYWHQLKLREIAATLGTSISAASTHKKRGLAALARQISR